PALRHPRRETAKDSEPSARAARKVATPTLSGLRRARKDRKSRQSGTEGCWALAWPLLTSSKVIVTPTMRHLPFIDGVEVRLEQKEKKCACLIRANLSHPPRPRSVLDRRPSLTKTGLREQGAEY